jgi:predicted dehydrogenase
VAYNGHNSHWNFRWWYQFSGGQMTDWGAHHNDIAQWANGTERSGPVSVDGRSLIPMIPGGYDAASQYLIRFEYANGVRMTVRSEDITVDFNRSDYPESARGEKVPNGVRFEGADGWIFVSRGTIQASKPELLEEPLPSNAVRLYRSTNHMGNFFECVRSRKTPICDVEIGHRSITTAHLGVISVRLGRALRWNPDREEFVDDREANRWLSRDMRAPYDWSFIG